MLKIITETDLRAAILHLESIQSDEQKLMKEQFLVAVESIKPINLIKSTLMEVSGSEAIHVSLLTSTIGLSLGFLSKILFQSMSKSPMKKIIGTALMFGVKNLVAHNPEKVKLIGKGLFNLTRKTLVDEDKQASLDETQ